MSLVPTSDQFPEFPVVPEPSSDMQTTMTVLTPEKLKATYRAEGKTFKDFATQNGYPYHEVIRVISGTNKARRGRGHQIAVALGLKDPTAV